MIENTYSLTVLAALWLIAGTMSIGYWFAVFSKSHKDLQRRLVYGARAAGMRRPRIATDREQYRDFQLTRFVLVFASVLGPLSLLVLLRLEEPQAWKWPRLAHFFSLEASEYHAHKNC